MASEKENMQVFKTIGAAFFAVGLVCVELLASGCGAQADGATDPDLGQTTEAVAAPKSLTHQLFGTDVSAGGTVNALFQCKDNGSANQDCRWVRPYQSYIPDTRPARLSVNTPGQRSDDAAIRAAALLVSNQLNGQMASANSQNNAVIDQNANSNCAVISEGVNTHVPSAETHVAKYLAASFGGCQGAPETEVTSQPGAFRSCLGGTCDIDTISLRANFPSSRFAGNMKQAVAACILIEFGEGLQNFDSTMNFNVFSTAAQSLSGPLENSQAQQLRKAAVSEFNPGGSTIYDVPCTGSICLN